MLHHKTYTWSKNYTITFEEEQQDSKTSLKNQDKQKHNMLQGCNKALQQGNNNKYNK